MRITTHPDVLRLYFTKAERNSLLTALGPPTFHVTVDLLTEGVQHDGAGVLCLTVTGHSTGRSLIANPSQLHPYRLSLGSEKVRNLHRLPSNKTVLTSNILKNHPTMRGMTWILPDPNDWKPIVPKNRKPRKYPTETDRAVKRPPVERPALHGTTESEVRALLHALKVCENAGWVFKSTDDGWSASYSKTLTA